MTNTTGIDLRELGEVFLADPYPILAELRGKGPVHRVRLGSQPEWLVVGYDAARTVLNHPAVRMSFWPDSTPAGLLTSEVGPQVSEVDPPQHTRLRKLVSRSFTAHRIAGLAPRIQQNTDELVDRLLGAGGGDLVQEFAVPLPVTVISELLGVDDLDMPAFREASMEVLGWTTDEQMYREALRRLAGQITTLIGAKRDRPGDDLLSNLVQTTDNDGDRLSPEELRGMAFALLIAGYETTASLIANGVLALLTHPDQLAALRSDWSLLGSAVDEMLRWSGPVATATARYTHGTVEVGDVVIPGGAQLVTVSLASANRDEARFPDGERFDIRRPPSGHIAFGHGIHYCLGSSLGILEAKTALRTLLERSPGLALDIDPHQVRWRPRPLGRALVDLPVRT
ncbi:cytochrome P450 family protein [Plantactinospora sp. WMMC1484]|uniref:cytochrome P450 family protein n=1 Tax=Plantactinospora sp. WMMC1484 TaxID=3404122 RepID=UPI003BF517E3